MNRRITQLALFLLSCSCAFGITVYPSPGGSPNDFNTGSGLFTGVAMLRMDGIGSCSGSLLYTGRHLLTAAHCLDDSPDAGTVHATFTWDGGSATFDGASTYIPQNWSGDILNGWDWAILVLANVVDNPAIERYLIGSDPSADFGEVTIAGYGYGGTGLTGENPSAYPVGVRRQGANETEAVWDGVGRGGNATLLFDFDGGDVNRLETLGVTSSTGLGAGREAMPVRGDSGGPTFRNGTIIGVHSFISYFGDTFGQYGDLATDTRISSYSALIEAQLGVPEPGSIVLLSFGLLALLVRARRPRRR